MSDTTAIENSTPAGPGLLGRLRSKIESPKRSVATLSGTLRDYLLATWAVPVDKVRPHVPVELPLDALPDEDGNLLAFIQVACFYHEDFHWSPLKGGGESFHQTTCRVLTRYQGKRGVFDLRNYLSTEEARNGLRVVARDADFARFTIHITGNPARDEYLEYNFRAVGDRGQTNVEVEFPDPSEEVAIPSPFARFDDMALFLTQRDEIYYAASVPKNAVGMMPLNQEPLTPRACRLKAARVSLFTDLGMLTPDTLLQPISVLLQPSFSRTAYPPRLVRLSPAA